jgi:hypothetical protein
MAVKFSDFTPGATAATTELVGYKTGTTTNTRYSLAQVGEGIFGVDFSISNFSWVNSTGYLGIGTDSPTALLDADGDAIFNKSSLDKDFRVVSDGNQYMFFVDGGTDRVGIGGAAPAKDLHIQRTSGETTLRLQSGGSYSDILQNGANLFIQNAAGGGSIIFYDDAAERMRIDTDGVIKITGQGYSELHDDEITNLTFNWNNGNIQTTTMGASSPTFTPTNPKIGATYILTLVQTGTVTATWTGVKWPAATAPTLSGAGKTDIITLICYNEADAGLYYGSSVLNFTT